MLVTALLVFSCDQNKIHQHYLDEGEQTYLGRPDSLKSYPGNKRLKLTWYQNADPRIETTVIYWNLRQDSLVLDFVRPEGNYGFQKDSIIIDELEEGSNTFELVNKNRYGERSLFSTIQGEVYGNSYIDRLRIRPIENIRITAFDDDTGAGVVQINWNSSPTNCVATIVRYKKYPSGEEVAIRVKSNDTGTELIEVGNRLFHPDDILYLTSLYLPPFSIDTLVSPELKEQITTYKVSAGTWAERDPATGAQLSGAGYIMPPDIVKHIWTTVPQENINILDCDRFGNDDVITNFTANLFRFTLNPDNTVDVSGYGSNYLSSNTGSNRWEPQRKSVYNPTTREFQMVYKKQVTGGNIFIYEETLVPR